MTSLSPEKARTGQMTHRQIAEALGVSRQLVGFALRGEGRMSDEMRQRILQTAQQGGYDQYSNGAARSMAARRYGKRNKTGLVAVLFPPAFEGRPLSSVPFFMSFFEGLESEAIARDLDLMLCPMRPSGLPRLVRAGEVDGVVCLVTDKTELEPLKQLDVPLVNIMVATSREHEVPQTSLLNADWHGGGVLATRHLLEQGHRRIAYIGYSKHCKDGLPLDDPKFDGYCDALREHGIAVDAGLVGITEESVGVNQGFERTQHLLRSATAPATPPFTGLVCYNDLLAMGGIRALQDAGLGVPEDVSVVGFDDVSTQYAFQPAVTSIRFPRAAMGRRAVELLSLCGGDAMLPPEAEHKEVFSVELVVYHSTGPARD